MIAVLDHHLVLIAGGHVLEWRFTKTSGFDEAVGIGIFTSGDGQYRQADTAEALGKSSMRQYGVRTQSQCRAQPGQPGHYRFLWMELACQSEGRLRTNVEASHSHALDIDLCVNAIARTGPPFNPRSDECNSTKTRFECLGGESLPCLTCEITVACRCRRPGAGISDRLKRRYSVTGARPGAAPSVARFGAFSKAGQIKYQRARGRTPRYKENDSEFFIAEWPSLAIGIGRGHVSSLIPTSGESGEFKFIVLASTVDRAVHHSTATNAWASATGQHGNCASGHKPEQTAPADDRGV